MLLRRLIRQVNNHNWFAVGIDFVIVVIGIIVAFQLQTWGEERAIAERSDRSLHQLYEESEAALDYWVGEVRRENGQQELQDRVIGALFAGNRSELTNDELAEALGGMGRYPTLTPPRRIYDELASAGLLREINSPEAMDKLAGYYESVEFIQGQIVFFRPTRGDAAAILDNRLTSVYDKALTTRQRIEVDFRRLSDDAEYLQTLSSEFRNQLVFQAYRRRVMRNAAEMCTALAHAVGVACSRLKDYEANRELPGWQVRNAPVPGNAG